jgi:hypothetical protein
MAVGTRHADYATLLYPQTWHTSSPTSGDGSVVIVRLWTKSHGVCLIVCLFVCLSIKMHSPSSNGVI